MTLVSLLLLALGASLLLTLANVLAARPQLAGGLALLLSLASFVSFGLTSNHDGVLLGMVNQGGLTALAGMTLSLVAALVVMGVLANPHKYQAGSVEIYAFILYTVLGAILMIAANNLLLLYIGIELSSYSTYILVGYYRDDRYSTEAAAKYFTLGAVASAVLLYGFSLLFGAIGTMYFDAMAIPIGSMPVIFWLGLSFLLVGFGFKLALVPFHAWTPDAYQGAPTMVAALLSVAPKAGAVIALGSLLIQVFGLAGIGQTVFVGLAAITMTVGNLQALGQRNLKRMLGYSSVAQLGTIIVGIAAGTMAGLEAVVFYMIGYALTNIGAFAAIAALKDAGVNEDLEAYRGLAKRTPFTALLLTLFLLSLAGVPLLAGFVGKLFVFKSAVDAGLISLALIALVNTVIAYFYYTRVIVRMWLMEADSDSTPVTVHGMALSALVIAALGVLVLGLVPGPFLDTISGALDAVKLIGSR